MKKHLFIIAVFFMLCTILYATDNDENETENWTEVTSMDQLLGTWEIENPFLCNLKDVGVKDDVPFFQFVYFEYEKSGDEYKETQFREDKFNNKKELKKGYAVLKDKIRGEFEMKNNSIVISYPTHEVTIETNAFGPLLINSDGTKLRAPDPSLPRLKKIDKKWF